jgi:hypothetical protein
MYGYYNYDIKPVRGLDITADADNALRQLEEAGWARSYRVRGESSAVERWTGAL